MSAVSRLSELSLSEKSDSPIVKEYNEKGFLIGKTTEIALHVLTVTAAVATAGFAFVACFVAAPWVIPVMIVSAVALSILFFLEFGAAIQPFLHQKLKPFANMVRATAIDFLAKLALACIYPFSQTLFDPKKQQCSSQHTPILLVHGYLHNSSAWGYFRYRLKLAGRKNIFTIDLGNPFLSVEAYAKKVDKKIKEIQQTTGRNDIDLIGHSMGGVVASYFATHMAKEANCEVKSAITLGSPLEGTRLQGLGPAAKQMKYQSDFIKGLRSKMLESEVPFYHIGSKTDLLILPTSSAVIKEHQHTLFENLGHVSYLFSDRVIRHCLLFYSKQNEAV